LIEDGELWNPGNAAHTPVQVPSQRGIQWFTNQLVIAFFALQFTPTQGWYWWNQVDIVCCDVRRVSMQRWKHLPSAITKPKDCRAVFVFAPTLQDYLILIFEILHARSVF
jgi:hypothetical protein